MVVRLSSVCLINIIMIEGWGVNTLRLNYYQDSGHGWIGVTRELVKELGIEDEISVFSYQLNQMVYLEEDCDAALLTNALTKKGIAFSLKDIVSNRSRIRSYNRYRVQE